MKKKSLLIIALVIIMAFASLMTACGEQTISSDLESFKADTAAVLQETVTEPAFSSVAGEWTIIALAKSGMEIDDTYYDDYYNHICQQVSTLEGKLSKTKYTEYARVSLAINAIGKEPGDVAGYDLLEPLKDVDAVTFQGITGPAFALIASNACNYDLGETTEQKYLDYIIAHEATGGGFVFNESAAEMDADVTAMVLQALAYYQDDADVKVATERAVTALADVQQESGGYAYSETNAQVIIAMTALGIDPMADERFAAVGSTLMSFQLEDGSFIHEAGGESDVMATEQALCALDALSLFKEGKMFY